MACFHGSPPSILSAVITALPTTDLCLIISPQGRPEATAEYGPHTHWLLLVKRRIWTINLFIIINVFMLTIFILTMELNSAVWYKTKVGSQNFGYQLWFCTRLCNGFWEIWMNILINDFKTNLVIDSWASVVKLSSHECHRTSLKVSQHWVK